MKPKLTMTEVANRFEEAAVTLRRLPGVRVPGYFSIWPEVIRTPGEIREMKKERFRLGPPPAKEISEMEETLTWLFLLDDENERRLIWLRSERVRWKIICRQLGCCRTTAYHAWRIALLKIVTGLNVRTQKL